MNAKVRFEIYQAIVNLVSHKVEGSESAQSTPPWAFVPRLNVLRNENPP